MRTTKQVFDEIMNSELFRIDGKTINLPEIILELCQAINGEDETNWYLGEGLECSLSDLIPGAYWSLTEWHGGQWSEEYAALCALGSIFSPGMTCPPESGEYPEWTAYDACNRWFESQQAK